MMLPWMQLGSKARHSSAAFLTSGRSRLQARNTLLVLLQDLTACFFSSWFTLYYCSWKQMSDLVFSVPYMQQPCRHDEQLESEWRPDTNDSASIIYSSYKYTRSNYACLSRTCMLPYIQFNIHTYIYMIVSSYQKLIGRGCTHFRNLPSGLM